MKIKYVFPLVRGQILALGLLATGLLGSCKDGTPVLVDGGIDLPMPADGSTLPPRICRTPGTLGAGPYFRDSTTQWKLDPTALSVAGIRLASADVDEDGFPDLVIHDLGTNNRDNLTATPPKRYKRLLRNNPAGGGRSFVDITDASGFTATRDGGLGRATHFAIFGDVNNDGHLDMFTGTYVNADPKAAPDPGDRSEILLGDGKGVFTLAPQSDIYSKEKRSTTSAAFLDYDRDGNLDLFIGFWYEIYGYLPAIQSRLYRGNGDGTFTDVTDKMGLTMLRSTGFAEGKNNRPVYGVTACDVDGDGDTDILVSAYGRQWNILWRNDGDRFVDVGRDSGFAGDDILDYSDNEFYRCYCKDTSACTAPAPAIDCSNYAWTPGSDDQPWRLNGNSFTTVCADVDNDGDMDLFNAAIRHWHIGRSADPSQVLVNTGAKTLRFDRPGNDKLGLARTHTISDWNEGDISAAVFDFDGDGLPDIMLMDSDYPDTHTWLFRQKPDHTFEEISKVAGIDHDRGQELTVADFDGDGDLDVIMGTSSARGGPAVPQVYFYENLVGNRSNWLKVKLVGAGAGAANTAAIGAWVRVTAGGVTQLREVFGGHGHFGLQHDLVLHFGLGASCDVDTIEVLWPDRKATRSTFTNVRANYLVEISQAAGLRYR
jgi:enediyne biosynthesis protein E4